MLGGLSFPSCVGKKKFIREVSARDSMILNVNSRVIELNQEIARQNLLLAERRGENNVLRELQDRQDQQIGRLQSEIEKLTNQSLSSQELMDMALQRTKEELAEKVETLENMRQTLDKQEKTAKEMLNEIQSYLEQYDQREISYEVKEGKASLGLTEKLLFKPGTIQFSKQAMDILEKIAGVLNKHPEVDIVVEGHTDNVSPKGKEFKDNWDLSAMRAAAVARILTKEFYLNPSQVMAAGKGEYLPKTSNETADGRSLNRRMEIVFSPRVDKIYRLIQETARKK